MDPKRPRKFTVRDGVVLIAAVAIGLAWSRGLMEETSYLTGGHGGEGAPWPPLASTLMLESWWVRASYSFVAALTIGMVWLRAFRPRPGLRRLTRQPGAVACGAVSAAVLVQMLPKLSGFVYLFYSGEPWWSKHWVVQGSFESMAVFVAWLLLVLSGRWQHEKGWVDLLGWMLGVFWLVVPPLDWVVREIVVEAIWRM